jgi:hypothetical protein
MQRGLLIVLGVVTIVGSAIPLAILPAIGRATGTNLVYFPMLLVGLTVHWAVGAVIVTRAHGNFVGWLIVAAAALLAASFGSYVAGLGVAGAGGSAPLAGSLLVVGAALFVPGIFMAAAIFMTFPNGRLPGPRWRWPVLLNVAMLVAGAIGVVARPGPVAEGLPDNPLGPRFADVPPAVLDIFDSLGQLSLAVAAALGLLAVGSRFRQARLEERRQWKLVMAAIIPAAVFIPVGLVGISGSLATNLARIGSAEGARVTDILTVIPLTLFNLAVAAAILRYRLYAIDRLISRTISYGLVSALLIAVFLLVNLGLQSALSSMTAGNSLAVAGSTLLAASLFSPVQRRVQENVNRRFDRGRYDAERTVAALAGRLRNEIALDTLSLDITDVVQRSLSPVTAVVWIRRREGSARGSEQRFW